MVVGGREDACVGNSPSVMQKPMIPWCSYTTSVGCLIGTQLVGGSEIVQTKCAWV